MKPSLLDRPLRVVMIGCDEHERRVYCRALSQSDLGFEVQICRLAETGSWKMPASDADAILYDDCGPQANGLTVLEGLRRSGCRLPFVLMTTSGRAPALVQALREGADDHIIKDHDRHYVQLLPDVMQRAISAHRMRVAAETAAQQLKVQQAELELRNMQLRSSEHQLLQISQRRAAETENRQREARLAEAQRVAHISSWELSLLDDSSWWSDSHYEICGVPRDFVPTFSSFLELVVPEDRPLLRQKMQAVVTGDSTTAAEFRIRRPSDGQIRWISSVGRVDCDHAARPIRLIGACRDITDERAAESALRNSERLARESLAEIEQLYRTAPIGLCLVDTELRFLRINDRLAEINGLPAADHLHRRVRDVLPEMAEQIEARYRQVLETGQPLRFEIRGSTQADPGRIKDWEVDQHPLRDDAGNIVGIQALVVDVTERKQSEERFRLAVESAPNAMVMVDQRGQITLVNSETERCFGYTRSELLGQSVELLVPGTSRGVHPQLRADYLQNPSVRRMGSGRELYGLRKDGSEFPVEIGLNPIETREGVCVLASVTDISARLALAKQVALHQEQLAHLGRVYLAGEMAAGIAHELNQPLTAISLKCEVCARMLQQPAQSVELAEVRQVLAEVSAQSRRAGRVVNFLRGFVQRSEPRRSTCDLGELVQRVVEYIGRQALDAQIELQLEPRPVLAAIDQIQIEQVLINLLRNAIDATQHDPPGERRVEVQTARAESGDPLIRVADNGRGFRGEDLHQIFDSFYTTKPSGMGLGLAICKSIVEAHKGRLWATKNPDRGLTLHVSLCRVLDSDPPPSV